MNTNPHTVFSYYIWHHTDIWLINKLHSKVLTYIVNRILPFDAMSLPEKVLVCYFMSATIIITIDDVNFTACRRSAFRTVKQLQGPVISEF